MIEASIKRNLASLSASGLPTHAVADPGNPLTRGFVVLSRDNLFGVARTWTNAGAGQVVASLWNVSDLATYRLMTRFVTGLKQGKVPELAMQAAQLETIQNYPNDPKMWASFTIIGKPSVDSREAEPAAATVQ